MQKYWIYSSCKENFRLVISYYNDAGYSGINAEMLLLRTDRAKIFTAGTIKQTMHFELSNHHPLPYYKRLAKEKLTSTAHHSQSLSQTTSSQHRTAMKLSLKICYYHPHISPSLKCLASYQDLQEKASISIAHHSNSFGRSS